MFLKLHQVSSKIEYLHRSVLSWDHRYFILLKVTNPTEHMLNNQPM